MAMMDMFGGKKPGASAKPQKASAGGLYAKPAGKPGGKPTMTPRQALPRTGSGGARRGR